MENNITNGQEKQQTENSRGASASARRNYRSSASSFDAEKVKGFEMALYKTGEVAPRKDTYEFVRYVNQDRRIPPPTADERVIPLDRGDRFPPIKSTEEAAWWQERQR